jgi:transcriptional regulator of acetoin/glycerol metabolism
MNVRAESLSEKTREMVRQDIADTVGVEASEVALFAITYELTNESMNLKEVVRKTLIRAIARSGGKISHAAKALGVTRKTLYAMIKKHEIENVVNIHD